VRNPIRQPELKVQIVSSYPPCLKMYFAAMRNYLFSNSRIPHLHCIPERWRLLSGGCCNKRAASVYGPGLRCGALADSASSTAVARKFTDCAHAFVNCLAGYDFAANEKKGRRGHSSRGRAVKWPHEVSIARGDDRRCKGGSEDHDPVLGFGTSMPNAVARSIWCSCSCIWISRMCSARANSPKASLWRTHSR